MPGDVFSGISMEELEKEMNRRKREEEIRKEESQFSKWREAYTREVEGMTQDQLLEEIFEVIPGKEIEYAMSSESSDFSSPRWDQLNKKTRAMKILLRERLKILMAR